MNRKRARDTVTAGRRVALMLTVPLLVTTLPAGGVTPPPLSGRLPADVGATLAEVDADVAAMRAGLAADAFTPRVAALFGVDAAELAAAPVFAPLPRDAAAAIAGLPADLREPVSTLLAGVTQARALLGDLPVDEVEAFLEPFAEGLRPERDAVSPFDFGEPGPAITRALQHNRQAALLVAQALDRALPGLRAASEARRGSPMTGRAVEGCDVLDALPLLCVGSEADNTFTDDAMLLISLGGNDTHLAGTGASPFLPPDGEVYVPIAVTVNLDGDDRYVAAPSVTWTTGKVLTVGSGAAAGGLGVLVDLAGDDVHEATIVVPPPGETGSGGTFASSDATVVAQGAGAMGTGLLFDEAGDDVYQAPGESLDYPVNTVVLAQGAGAVGGVGNFCYWVPATNPPFGPSCSVGALVDGGGGDDRYEIDGGRLDLTDQVGGGRWAFGQGFGATMLGVLFDDGGRDALRVAAGVSTPLFDAYTGPKPRAVISVQGVGVGQGVGMVLTGDGPTTYEVVASSSGLVQHERVWAQGVSYGFWGQGVLDDRGGDDRFQVISEITYDRTIDAGIDGIGPHSISTSGGGKFDNFVIAQGAAEVGLGYLRDHGGDDTYLVTAASRTDVHVVDDRASGAPDEQPDQSAVPMTVDVSGYTPPALVAQGATKLGSAAGVLIDDAGTDRYVARSLGPVSVTAEATVAPRVTANSRAASHHVFAQGASEDGLAGILADLGGAGDRFEAEGSNVVTAPAGADTFQMGLYWPRLQGHGTGAATLLALGEQPVVLATPRRDVCAASPQPRGFGTWFECGVGAAAGHAPGAEGDPTHVTVELGERTTTAGGDRVAVTVHLAGDAGEPMADRLVHVNMQFGGASWENWWQEDGLTDADGGATVSLPLELGLLGTGNQFRIAATFSGEAGRYPAYASTPITLQ